MRAPGLHPGNFFRKKRKVTRSRPTWKPQGIPRRITVSPFGACGMSSGFANSFGQLLTGVPAGPARFRKAISSTNRPDHIATRHASPAWLCRRRSGPILDPTVPHPGDNSPSKNSPGPVSRSPGGRSPGQMRRSKTAGASLMWPRPANRCGRPCSDDRDSSTNPHQASAAEQRWSRMKAGQNTSPGECRAPKDIQCADLPAERGAIRHPHMALRRSTRPHDNAPAPPSSADQGGPWASHCRPRQDRARSGSSDSSR